MGYLLSKHPKGVGAVLVTAALERFSFYGVRSFLVLYMTLHLLIPDTETLGTYAAFMALFFVSPLLGGVIADYVWERDRVVSIGLFLMALSYISLLFLPSHYFNLGLAFLIVGNGFYKTNLVPSFGELYENKDMEEQRSAGFTYFYIACNFGSFAALVCGVIALKPESLIMLNKLPYVNIDPMFFTQDVAWKVGFALAAAVAIAAFFSFFFFEKTEPKHKYGTIGLKKLPLSKGSIFSLLACIVSVFLFERILNNYRIMDVLSPLVGLLALGVWGTIALKTSAPQRKALWALFVLLIFNVIFFAVTEQRGGALLLFLHRNVDRVLWGGYELPAAVFQGINPLGIIVFGPMLASLREEITKKKIFSACNQFGMALLLSAVSMACLYAGCLFVGVSGKSALSWPVISIFLTSFAELCCWSIGASLMTRLAPKKYAGTISAIWFSSLAFSYYIGGLFGRYMMSSADPNALPDAQMSMYSTAFAQLTVASFIVWGGFLICIKPLEKAINGWQGEES